MLHIKQGSHDDPHARPVTGPATPAAVRPVTDPVAEPGRPQRRVHRGGAGAGRRLAALAAADPRPRHPGASRVGGGPGHRGRGGPLLLVRLELRRRGRRHPGPVGRASPRLLDYAVAMAACFHLFVTGYEERTLARRFGPAYLQYRRAVPRWLPRKPDASQPAR